ncbi:F-box/LRR-repeat protein 4-like [Lolium rigidum]|uniref:F-box/LRR-repeat protein 4-like n=1 Tax=Lolium rigidum TaxID=89674 RepID=UPI001F5C9615|nr:F-box/LRR-repeat protein 4-like [Lolium rigidum]
MSPPRLGCGCVVVAPCRRKARHDMSCVESETRVLLSDGGTLYGRHGLVPGRKMIMMRHELTTPRALPTPATEPTSPRRGGGGRRAGTGGGGCGGGGGVDDAALCDDLLQEVFGLLPPAAAPAVSLVSRRWLALLRASTSRLTLRLPPASNTGASPSAALADLLSRYPYLSALAVVSAAAHDADLVLLAVAASPSATRLTALRFSLGSPVSPATLSAVSLTFSGLTSLHLTALSPLSFRWLACLPCLKSFALVNSASPAVDSTVSTTSSSSDAYAEAEAVAPLPLERLSLCGIRSGHRGLGWLWQRCGSLRWLQLRACDSIGDGPASTAFPECLHGLLELELRACRSVADRVLLLAADRCHALTSLLVYDGGSREALLHFMHQRAAALHTLDLRLPLDLHNDHLLAIGADHNGHHSQATLAVLRLQSCVLITGDGLRSLAHTAIGAGIQEVALVSCDVLEREPGLLTFLSQSMRQLRRLDLSYNETLKDKEIGAMLSSCRNLIDIRFRGCRCLTGESLVSLLRHCGRSVEVLDISRCPGIKGPSVEFFALRATRLNHLIIEESSASEELKAIAQTKGIKLGPLPCEGSF